MFISGLRVDMLRQELYPDYSLGKVYVKSDMDECAIRGNVHLEVFSLTPGWQKIPTQGCEKQEFRN